MTTNFFGWHGGSGRVAQWLLVVRRLGAGGTAARLGWHGGSGGTAAQDGWHGGSGGSGRMARRLGLHGSFGWHGGSGRVARRLGLGGTAARVARRFGSGGTAARVRWAAGCLKRPARRCRSSRGARSCSGLATPIDIRSYFLVF